LTPRTRTQSNRRLLDQLRARGIRLTSQRVVLMSILEAQEGFLDVATLCAMCRRKGAAVDRATVYRTLAMLRANHLLAPATHGAPSSDGNGSLAVTQDEFGLVCEQCGTHQPVAPDAHASIKRELQRSTGFDARAVRLVASGECRLCSAKSRLRSKPGHKPTS
jgi:Fe2+ or Zn2+ uptake regulation protein